MNVFREALMMGRYNNDTIGPEAFASVCAKHGLLRLVCCNEKQRISVNKCTIDSFLVTV